MIHLQLPFDAEEGSCHEIIGADYHYLAHVLRVTPGRRIDAIDLSGSSLKIEIQSVSQSSIVVKAVAGSLGVAQDDLPPITLFQAVPKGRKLEEIVRINVQSGVTRIVPVITERTVSRPGDRFESRRERLNRIAREAVQQSGSAPASVDPLIDLDQVTADPDALSLILHTEPLESPTLHGYLSDEPSRIELLVGPEGGFSGNEIARLRKRGFQPVYLGSQVLRTEVAALYAVAAIRVVLLERDEWRPTTSPPS